MTAKELHDVLDVTVARILDAIHPDRIILFGSRATGSSRPSSDFDILVIKDSQEPRFRRSAPLYRLLADVPAEFDILVYTPAEVEEWAEVPQAFVTHAIRTGRVLYERAA